MSTTRLKGVDIQVKQGTAQNPLELKFYMLRTEGKPQRSPSQQWLKYGWLWSMAAYRNIVDRKYLNDTIRTPSLM